MKLTRITTPEKPTDAQVLRTLLQRLVSVVRDLAAAEHTEDFRDARASARRVLKQLDDHRPKGG